MRQPMVPARPRKRSDSARVRLNAAVTRCCPFQPALSRDCTPLLFAVNVKNQLRLLPGLLMFGERRPYPVTPANLGHLQNLDLSDLYFFRPQRDPPASAYRHASKTLQNRLLC